MLVRVVLPQGQLDPGGDAPGVDLAHQKGHRGVEAPQGQGVRHAQPLPQVLLQHGGDGIDEAQPGHQAQRRPRRAGQGAQAGHGGLPQRRVARHGVDQLGPLGEGLHRLQHRPRDPLVDGAEVGPLLVEVVERGGPSQRRPPLHRGVDAGAQQEPPLGQGPFQEVAPLGGELPHAPGAQPGDNQITHPVSFLVSRPPNRSTGGARASQTAAIISPDRWCSRSPPARPAIRRPSGARPGGRRDAPAPAHPPVRGPRPGRGPHGALRGLGDAGAVPHRGADRAPRRTPARRPLRHRAHGAGRASKGPRPCSSCSG